MDIADNLRDAAYIVIGMGVIGAQRAQVRREELRKQFDAQRQTIEARANEARSLFEKSGADAVKIAGDLVKQVETRVAPLRDEVFSRVS